MTLLTPSQFALILIVVATYLIYIKWLRSKYPPGPWPLPIIGNLHLLSRKPYVEFTKMTKVYGPVFTIWMGWQPTVVISDLHHIKEATLQKGVDFAGRSMETFAYREIFNNSEGLSSPFYDKKVQTLRKLGLSIMKAKSIGGFSILKVVEEEMMHLMEILKGVNGKLVDPCLFVLVPISNIVLRAILNVRFENEHDVYFLKWKDTFSEFISALEIAVIASIAPALWYIIPGIQKRIQSHIKPLNDFIDQQLTLHEETYQKGVIRDLTDVIIEHQQNQSHNIPVSEKITKKTMCALLKNMLTAGAETSVTTTLWSFLVLLHRRDIQQKVQRELDQYNQRTTLLQTSTEDKKENYNPCRLVFTAVDKPNLPYLNAFIHETMRLFSIGPLGVPHRSIVDTSVGSHLIPNDTSILFNVDACHKDEKTWEKPLDFMPERFLDRNGLFNNEKAKQIISFGAGPRSCVGENIAKMELFICLANVLHKFELCCPSVDELPVLNDGIFRLELAPYPFKMIFKIRE